MKPTSSNGSIERHRLTPVPTTESGSAQASPGNANASAVAFGGNTSKQAGSGVGLRVTTQEPTTVAKPGTAMVEPSVAPAPIAAVESAADPDSLAGKASSLGGDGAPYVEATSTDQVTQEKSTGVIDREKAIQLVSQDGLKLAELQEFWGDEEVVMAAIKKDGRALQYASEELKGDEEVVDAAVKKTPAALQFASQECVASLCMDNGMLLEHAGEFQNDDLVVQCAISNNTEALKFATEQCVLGLILNRDVGLNDAFSHAKEAVQNKLRTSFEVQESAIKKNRMQLAYATRDVVLKMVAKDGMLLEHASEDLKNDIEVVKAAVKQNSGALQFAKRDRVLNIVSENGLALENAPEVFKNDVEVVQAAMASDPTALQFAKRDRVLNIVSENGLALEHAPESLKNDVEVVQAAMASDLTALQLATRDCVLKIVSENGLDLEYAPEELKNDVEVVQAAMAYDPTALQFATRDCVKLLLKNSAKDGVLTVVSENGMLLEYASEALKNDPDVVQTAVDSDPTALKFATKNCVLNIVSKKGILLKYAPKGLNNDQEVVRASIKSNGIALQFASIDCVKELVSEDGLLLKYVGQDQLNQNPELIIFAMEQNPAAIFELDHEESLVTRTVNDRNTSAVTHPVPVTVQAVRDGGIKVQAATYGGYFHPDVMSSRTLVYIENGVISAKRDIASSIVTTLPSNLKKAYEFYAQTEQTKYQHMKAYTALYELASDKESISRYETEFKDTSPSVELFKKFLESYEKIKNLDKAIESHKFRSPKQMKDKLEEKAWQLQKMVSGSSKHILHHLFSKDTTFQTLKENLADPEKSEESKKEMLLFLIQHKAEIQDFTRVLHKLYHKTPQEIFSYLEKGSEALEEDLQLKLRLNEQIQKPRTKPKGYVIAAHNHGVLQAELKEIQEDRNEGLSLYTPPSCFGMREVEISKMNDLVKIWGECNSAANPTEMPIERLESMMKTDFDHVMPSLVGLTKNLSIEKSQAIWEAVGEYVNGSVQKNQIGHYLLCQLIIENNTETFKTNYQQLQAHLNCDWEAVGKQFYQFSVMRGGKIFPGMDLARNSGNREAIKFFDSQ